MKKLLMTAAIASISLVGMAQETEELPVQKHCVATNSFWSNWFIQAGAGWNTWYSSQEHGQGLPRSPFKKFRSNPGFAVAIGKWFTPGIALRTKLQGIWGKTVVDATGRDNGNKYWSLNEHVLFNLNSLVKGYNPDRRWSVIPFLGAGIGRSFTHNRFAMNLSIGLMSEVYLCEKTAIHIEMGWNYFESDIDGMEHVRVRRGWSAHDNHLYAEVGLTYRLGKATWSKVPDTEAMRALSQAELDALNAQLSDANAENERLQTLLNEQKPTEETATPTAPPATEVSVFFDHDDVLSSPKDLVDVAVLADYAKENHAKLTVTGYADSATGHAEQNQTLAERRAQCLANELIKMGIAKEDISIVAKGGVSQLSPAPYNRRATVQITTN